MNQTRNRQTNKPKLRFSEFMGNWSIMKAEEIFENYINKNHIGELPLLAATQTDGIVYRDNLDLRIHSSEAGIKSYKIIEPGNFVISLRSFQGGIEYSDILGISSPAYTILKSKIPICDYFYKIYFKKQSFISKLNGLIYGIRDGKQISYSEFKVMDIPFPTLGEQTRIADFLTAVDEKISKMQNKVELLKKYKKGVMQKIFSQKIRFKDENGKDYSDWEEKSISEIFERITEKNKENNKNVLTISAQYGLINQEDFFNKSVAANDLSGYYLLHKNDFAYNKSYSNGYPMGAIKKLNLYNKGVVSSLYICFRAQKYQDPNFYEQYFEYGQQNREIEKIAQEGARNHGLLNISVIDFFEQIYLQIPSYNEQVKIAEFLTTVDFRIDLEERKLEQSKRFKKSLLQLMFI
jgi:type I restriction enzyme S subunit